MCCPLPQQLQVVDESLSKLAHEQSPRGKGSGEPPRYAKLPLHRSRNSARPRLFVFIQAGWPSEDRPDHDNRELFTPAVRRRSNPTAAAVNDTKPMPNATAEARPMSSIQYASVAEPGVELRAAPFRVVFPSLPYSARQLQRKFDRRPLQPACRASQLNFWFGRRWSAQPRVFVFIQVGWP